MLYSIHFSEKSVLRDNCIFPIHHIELMLDIVLEVGTAFHSLLLLLYALLGVCSLLRELCRLVFVRLGVGITKRTLLSIHPK